ncbi:MAG: DUF2156 domain-containing protein [Lachnospiraceae bacterium]|nr:DUF2156 domain-containing protein [Lachnospiraceae bacterium]
MLQFEKLELKHIPLLNEYIKYKLDNNCDCTIGGTFIWRDYYGVSYAHKEDMLFFKVDMSDGMEGYCFPLAENKEKALLTLKEHCSEIGRPLILCSVTDIEMKYVEKVFTDFEVRVERDKADYVYNSIDMAEFAGRRYSGQRNHINKFKKLYENYTFEEITEDNLHEVREFFVNYFNTYKKDADSYDEEAGKILEFMDNFKQYGLFGGFLRVDGNIMAMSVGEIVDDTLYIHIEKADISYHGAYQMIVQCFAKHYVREGIEYINREDDMGDPGLRTSKMSYHPVRLIDKSDVLVK